MEYYSILIIYVCYCHYQLIMFFNTEDLTIEIQSRYSDQFFFIKFQVQFIFYLTSLQVLLLFSINIHIMSVTKHCHPHWFRFSEIFTQNNQMPNKWQLVLSKMGNQKVWKFVQFFRVGKLIPVEI